MARHVFQQSLGPSSFVAVPADRHVQAPHRDPESQAADIHVTRVEPAFGQLYGVCACGARSLPMDHPADAAQWECPYAAAAVEVLRNRLAWQQRVLDAAIYGLVR